MHYRLPSVELHLYTSVYPQYHLHYHHQQLNLSVNPKLNATDEILLRVYVCVYAYVFVFVCVYAMMCFYAHGLNSDSDHGLWWTNRLKMTGEM